MSTCCDVFGLHKLLLFLTVMTASKAFGHTVHTPHLTIFVLTQAGNLSRVEEERDRTRAAEAITAC